MFKGDKRIINIDILEGTEHMNAKEVIAMLGKVFDEGYTAVVIENGRPKSV